MSVHRSGLLERILDGMQRVPVVRRLAALLEPRRTLLIELVSTSLSSITAIPAVRPGDPARVSEPQHLHVRAGSQSWAVWATHHLLRAFAIGGLEAVAGNVLFFVLRAGRVRARSTCSSASSGWIRSRLVRLEVSSVRDIVWIGAGLLLIWPAAVRERHGMTIVTMRATTLA